ncbi:SAM-dependent methyltransferase [Nocardia zapadnayensis]|uniref:SAM-dependent methyltransferase n=1 Tax=Nocardia rhamnosiphila TaxID=426716 RepID=UPI00224756F4|nr:SAM-dependent methyltransferase [Nocardia zapadnayensis]MCX0271237.1 SAM-dependent methyltransferase [Nocardia zapadnayensis]
MDRSGLNPHEPHIARMYDYYLGGKDHYPADAEAAEKVLQALPDVRLAAQANRGFIHRATRHLAREAGVTQFLDIGTGIPTEPNLHQVAQEEAPASRVVYVDNDPIVLAHARALMVGAPEGRTDYIQADATRPEEILAAARRTLDFDEPIALSLIALLNFVPGAYEITETLMAAVAPGSYLAMTHLTADFDPKGIAATVKVYEERGMHCHPRNRAEIAKFFDGMEILDPGVVPIHRWRPPIEPAKSMDTKVPGYAAVGRKA